MSLVECTAIDGTATTLEDEIIPAIEGLIANYGAKLKDKYLRTLLDLADIMEELIYQLSHDEE